MTTYTVELTAAARQQLTSLERRPREMAAAVISALSFNPRPHGCVKLAGRESLWRIRFSRYRIVYRIEHARLLVLIVKIGNRKDVYR